MKVYIVSLEWNQPSSEVCGDTGIVGVYATQAAAEAAGVAERKQLSDDGSAVYEYDNIEGAFCAFCGEPAPRDSAGQPTPCQCVVAPEADPGWCDYCGAELYRLECSNDHEDWDVDVHVTEHEVQEAVAPAAPCRTCEGKPQGHIVCEDCKEVSHG